MDNHNHQGLRIIKPSDSIPVDHPIFLIFGQPGICKSSPGFSARDPVTVNFDGENGLARAVNRKEALDIATIDQLRELRRDPDILKPFASIVIDTVGRALDLMTLEIIDDTPKYGRNGNLTQQGWGDLKTRFRTWMTQLRGMQKDIVLLAHHKEEKDNDLTCVRPDIVGGSLAEVLKISDFVGYLAMNGKQRVLDFSPTEKWFGKNPANWKPFTVPEPAKAQQFLAKLFDEGRAALGKISEASAGIARQLDDWRADIQTYTRAEEFNRAVPKIRALPEPLLSQVAKVLLDEAERRKIPRDKETRTFLEPAIAVGAGAGQGSLL